MDKLFGDIRGNEPFIIDNDLISIILEDGTSDIPLSDWLSAENVNAGENSQANGLGSVAIGPSAIVNVDGAIQIGKGTLSDTDIAFQLYSYPILSNDGLIVKDRYPQSVSKTVEDKINVVSNDVNEALLTSDIYTYRMTYKGEWQEGVTYRHGDVVRHLSGLEIYKNSEHVYYKKDDQEWWEIGNNHTKYYIKGAAFISSDGLSSECIISNNKITGFDVISISYEASKDTYSEISDTILLTSDTDLFKSGGKMKNEDIGSDNNTAMYFGDIKVSKLYQGEKQLYPLNTSNTIINNPIIDEINDIHYEQFDDLIE